MGYFCGACLAPSLFFTRLPQKLLLFINCEERRSFCQDYFIKRRNVNALHRSFEQSVHAIHGVKGEDLEDKAAFSKERA